MIFDGYLLNSLRMVPKRFFLPSSNLVPLQLSLKAIKGRKQTKDSKKKTEKEFLELFFLLLRPFFLLPSQQCTYEYSLVYSPCMAIIFPWVLKCMVRGRGKFLFYDMTFVLSYNMSPCVVEYTNCKLFSEKQVGRERGSL